MHENHPSSIYKNKIFFIECQPFSEREEGKGKRKEGKERGIDVWKNRGIAILNSHTSSPPYF